MRGLLFFLVFIMVLFVSAQKESYSISNLKINTEYPHFGLMFIENDTKVLFTSYLLDKKGRFKRSLGNPILTIYEGSLSNTGQIENVKQVVIDSKQNIPQITSAVKSSDGKQLYITTTYTYKNKPEGTFKETNFHISVGEYMKGVGWTNFEVLPFCNPKFSYAHPAFSKDGKTLYFTANIRGGKETTKGGSDIFSVTILENGKFSKPKNLGSRVNSYGREMFPFISEDNVLYFASNRPNGFGGFDIYKSIINENGDFEKAVKMPKPINSNKDDFSLIIKSNSGYLSSKRDKGKGDDDIYYFKKN